MNVYEAKKNKSEYINKRQKCAITVMENFSVADLEYWLEKRETVSLVIPIASPPKKVWLDISVLQPLPLRTH